MSKINYAHLGYKYQKVDKGSGKVKTLRVLCETEKSGSFKLVNDDGAFVVKTAQHLNDEYVMIKPDAIMNLMVTDSNSDTGMDIYVCLHKIDQILAKNQIPAVVMRQNVMQDEDEIDIGDKKLVGKMRLGGVITDPYNEGVTRDFMAFKEVDQFYSMALYIDDDLDTIMEVLNPFMIETELRKAFNQFKRKLGPALAMVDGVCDHILDFMNKMDFMAYFRGMFNITQVDWPLEMSQTVYEDDGKIILNHKQAEKIDELLDGAARGHRLYAIKYDKDIDISKIVSFKHIVISDQLYRMYLVVIEN